MYKKISLNGEWTLSGKDKTKTDISVPCTIPGYAHPALEKAGYIPEMFWRKNTEESQWIEDVEWTFTRTFDLSCDQDFSRAVLSFGGIDTYSDVYLNGQNILTTDNMFVPYSAKVSDILRGGENTLSVVVHPYKTVAPKPDTTKYRAAFCHDRAMVRRLQCTFFWDWVDRYVTAGIWQDVELSFLPEAIIEDVFTEVTDICETSASINFQIKTENAVKSGCRFKIDITDPDGSVAWDLEGRVFMDTMYLQADLPEPKLWWPNGYGEHPLYTVTVSIFDKDGNELDKKSHRIGIRTVRFECLRDRPDSDEERRTKQLLRQQKKTDSPISDEVLDEQIKAENPMTGESFIILVNGKRIFATGGNWVPCTPFPTSGMGEQYRKLLTLAVKGNQNILRVWGGGLYELDEFYDICDELGIMVTQDFLLACGKYPDDLDWWVESFNKELRANIIRLRNHASLIAWFGNNEDGDGFDWDDPNMKNMALQYKSNRPILNELDPNRPFRPCCSWGGKGNTDPTIGDCHLTWWFRGAENIDPSWFDIVGRMATESAIEGYPLPTSLRKFLSEDDILDRDSDVIEYHIKNNMYFEPAGLLSVHNRLKKSAEVVMGRSDNRYEDIYRLSYIQYEWARMVLEGARRSNWYCSGILYWMYNDCWPALGYAVVDYYGVPKSGWYATKYSGAPIAATIRENGGELYFTVLNHSLEACRLDYKIKLYQIDDLRLNEVTHGRVDVKCNANTHIVSVPEKAFDSNGGKNIIIFLELYRDGELISRARWYPEWISNLKLPKAEVEVTVDRNKKTVTATCQKGVAIGLAFDADAVFEDNYIDLLEGETKIIPYTTLDGFDKIDVYGYNIDIVNGI